MSIQTGVLEFLIKGTVATTGSGTKNFFNVFHYRSNTIPVPDSKVAVLNFFLSAIWSLAGASLSSAYTGVESDVRLLDEATDQYAVGNVPASGAVAGARLPTDVSASVLLRTSLRGKNYRGAKRFGPLASSDVVNDEITAAAITAHWAALIAALSGGMTGGGLSGTYTPIVVSRFKSQLSVDPTTIDGAPITAALLNKTVGTMRRRKEKTVR